MRRRSLRFIPGTLALPVTLALAHEVRPPDCQTSAVWPISIVILKKPCSMRSWSYRAKLVPRPPDTTANALSAQAGAFDVKAPKALMGDTAFPVGEAPRVVVNADR